jgi:hypothetical protein
VWFAASARRSPPKPDSQCLTAFDRYLRSGAARRGNTILSSKPHMLWSQVNVEAYAVGRRLAHDFTDAVYLAKGHTTGGRDAPDPEFFAAGSAW